MKKKQFILFLVLAAFLAAIDQLIKYYIVSNYNLQEEKKVLGNVLVLTHIRNNGTLWGLFGGRLVFLLILTTVISALIFYVFYHAAGIRRYRVIRILLAVLFGGAIGNLIDRIRLHYVVDYIYVKIIHFPVFNFADICVTCSIFLLAGLLIFYYDVKDFDVLIGDSILKEDGTYEEKPNGGTKRKTED